MKRILNLFAIFFWIIFLLLQLSCSNNYKPVSNFNNLKIDTSTNLVLLLKHQLEHWHIDSFEQNIKSYYKAGKISTSSYNNLLGSYFLAKGNFDSLSGIINKIEHHNNLSLSENNLLARYYLEQNEYNKSKFYFDAALKQSNNKDCNNKQKTILYINYGSFYYYYSKLDSAKVWYNKARKSIIENKLETSVVNALCLYNIGALYGEYANYNTKEKYLLKSKNILDKLDLNHHPLQAKIFGSMAGLKISTDDYNSAIYYSLKDIDNIESNFGKKHYELYYSYNNLGVIYRQLKEYTKAENYLMKAKTIAISNFGLVHENIVDALIELSTIYFLNNKNNIALNTINKAIAIETTINKNSIVICNANVLKAEILLKEKQFNTANNLLHDCINNYNNHYGNKNPYSANCFLKLSEIALNKNLIDTSYYYVNKAIKKIVQHDSILYSYDYWLAIEQLCNIINTSKDTNQYSNTLLHKINKAITIANSLRFNYYGYFTKATITEKMDNLYKTAYDCAYYLYKKTNNNKYTFIALDYSSQSKYALLNREMRKAYLRAKLPNNINQQLNYLYASIRTWQELIESSNDNYLIHNYQKKIANAELQVLSIEKEHILLKQKSSTALVKQIQNKLKQQEVFIDYFFTNNNLYQITIEPNNITIKQLDESKEINNKINQLKQSISTLQFNDSLAYVLYQQLIPRKKHTNIIFCLHENLATIPFETLKTNPKKDFKYFYIFSNNINYCNSLYHYLNKNKQQYIASANIIKPNYRNKSLQLNYALLESKSIKNKFIKTNNIDTYQKLKASLNKARLLHFIAHTHQNNKTPLASGILFDKNSIFSTKDFLTYASKADVAILATCKSNFGENIKAEGNLNLVYSLQYIGINKLIYSLWNLNDKSTQQIISKFYYNWKWKNAMAISLQNAKKEYLAQADAMACQPYFWAGITQQSNYQKIIILNKQIIISCTIILIFLLLSIVLLIFKK